MFQVNQNNPMPVEEIVQVQQLWDISKQALQNQLSMNSEDEKLIESLCLEIFEKWPSIKLKDMQTTLFSVARLVENKKISNIEYISKRFDELLDSVISKLN